MISTLHGHDIANKAALSRELAEQMEDFFKNHSNKALAYLKQQDAAPCVFPKPRPLARQPIAQENHHERRAKILAFIASHPGCTANQIHRQLRVEQLKLSNDMRYFGRSKQVTYEKKGKTHLYSLVVKEDEA